MKILVYYINNFIIINFYLLIFCYYFYQGEFLILVVLKVRREDVIYLCEILVIYSKFYRFFL